MLTEAYIIPLLAGWLLLNATYCFVRDVAGYYNASLEVAYTQAYYRENIFPSLRPHQHVLLVPGTFGCADLGLNKSDAVVVSFRRNLHVVFPPSNNAEFTETGSGRQQENE